MTVASAPALATPRPQSKPRQPTSLWSDARRRFSRNKLALEHPAPGDVERRQAIKALIGELEYVLAMLNQR